MRIPTENETRSYFERLNNFLAPIDRSRGTEAVILYAGKPAIRCSAYSTYPSLKRLWETWADRAIFYRRQRSLIDEAVQCWQNGNKKTRQTIEHWLDAAGKTSWSRRFASIEKATPSYHMSLEHMPRGWREQILRDLAADVQERSMTFHERIRAKISQLNERQST